MGTDRSAGDVTEDTVLGGRLRLRQPRRGHRVGHDAILLAAAVPARAGETVAAARYSQPDLAGGRTWRRARGARTGVWRDSGAADLSQASRKRDPGAGMRHQG